MRCKLNPVRWERGTGEFLGFAVCAVILTVLMLAIMAFSNYSTHDQQLSVATYAAGRAAVVSSEPDLANARAEAVLKTVYTDCLSSSPTGELNQVWYTITYDGEWRIGNIATITVYQHLGAIFPLTEQDIECSIAMMIEDQID